LAIGANCFNMAVVLPYVSYAVYQMIGGKSLWTSRRRIVAAAVGGWVGLTVASFFAGFEFGIQPFLFHTVDGTPLYAPYPLSVSIPAMVIPHALIASVVEAVVTALVVAYLQRSNLPVLQLADRPQPELIAEAGRFKRLRALYVVLAVAIVAVPLGLLAPGTAWGEWNSQQLAERGLSAIPQGFAQLENLWSAPLSGYDLPSLGNSNVGYILSAIVGVVIITIVAWLFTRLLTRTPAAKS
jgi:cobalt/nickel transport system permease protein